MTDRGRHVLVLSVVFPPDNVSTAHLVADLTADLVTAGHRVTVITTTPHSRPDPGARRDFPGVRVIRIPVPRKGSSALRNALIWLIYLKVALWTGMFRGRRPDVVLAVTPPPGIGLVGSWIARRWRSRLIYNVKELYPDVAVALGVLDARPLVAMMRWTERRAFHQAAVVVAVTESVAARIRSRSAGTTVEVISDGVDVDAVAPGVDPTAFRSEFGIIAPLVVGYAGNMGVPQNLDLLVDAAGLLADLPVQIVLVGAGTERQHLIERAAAGSGNVIIVSQQPVARVPEIYAACDVMFVPLAPGLGTQVMPSKVFQALAAERPFIAAAPADSGVTALAVASGAGFTVPELTPEALAAVIRSIDRTRLPAMGQRGRQHVIEHYSRQAVAAAYLRLIA